MIQTGYMPTPTGWKPVPQTIRKHDEVLVSFVAPATSRCPKPRLEAGATKDKALPKNDRRPGKPGRE